MSSSTFRYKDNQAGEEDEEHAEYFSPPTYIRRAGRNTNSLDLHHQVEGPMPRDGKGSHPSRAASRVPLPTIRSATRKRITKPTHVCLVVTIDKPPSNLHAKR